VDIKMQGISTWREFYTFVGLAGGSQGHAADIVEVVVDAMWHQQPVGEVAKVVVVDALDIRAVASAAPAISPGQQDAVADHERLAQTQARAVQETAILPSGI
jgi:hypothetical protein